MISPLWTFIKRFTNSLLVKALPQEKHSVTLLSPKTGFPSVELLTAAAAVFDAVELVSLSAAIISTTVLSSLLATVDSITEISVFSTSLVISCSLFFFCSCAN